MDGVTRDDGRGDVADFSKAWLDKAFLPMFEQGMSLLEQARDFVRDDGAELSAKLPMAEKLSYVVATTRLTAALLQCSWWLFEQRAIREGEIERPKREGASFNPKLPTGEALAAMPDKLKALIRETEALSARVASLEALMHPEAEPAAPTP
jgi:regulator of CtrA degradation